MDLLLASNNQGKLKEVKAILSDLPITLFTPQTLAEQTPKLVSFKELEVEETGKTFQENALLKAREFAQKSQLLTIAEDSGLEVKSLNGFPGVKSKRWHLGTDKDRNLALLKKIQEKSDRLARFTAVICLFNPQDNTHQFFQGAVEGKLAEKSSGSAGFGYDPIFIPQGYTQTFGQLGIDEKNQLSHRRQALDKLKEYLLTQL